jgi:hypothetical protein
VTAIKINAPTDAAKTGDKCHKSAQKKVITVSLARYFVVIQTPKNIKNY